MKYLLIFNIATILLFSCTKNEDKFATLSIQLKDAPASFDSVLVEVLNVEVHTDMGGWQSLQTHQGIYNLLELQDNVDTALVMAQQLPAGLISQVRLILGVNNRVVVSGVSYPLSISSQDETGLKLNIHEVLQPNTPYVLVMDFDALQSIHQTGNGAYKLKPVVRAEFL